MAQFGREAHADGDRFAVKEAAGGKPFDRVSEGVAIFQDHAGSAFGWVLAQNGELRFDDEPQQIAEVVVGTPGVKYRFRVSGVGPRNEYVLDPLHNAAPLLSLGLRQRVGRVGPDEEGGVKDAELVLAMPAVDGLLVAQGAVGLGGYGSGHTDEANTSVEQRGRQPDHVADQAAAKRNQDRILG